ncbi:hypothetical protein [Streptomyces uncialis]|uniref:Transcriptional regulator n=1 Tax=Streptomyces uncialis TaxID=1048205 RepID=A0A1Q4V8M5_9ACTN|nr:hypothetical protein [Streptomyces uncialis]OKH94109.1 hypothetical protein AB852_15860 [Streptomyces uncialis]
MARHQPNQRLGVLLNEADWNPADLARAVNGIGKAQGLTLRYDRTSVAHWLTGSRPRPPVPDLVASAFSRRTGRLVTVGETGLARPGRPADDPLLASGAGTDDVVDRLTVLSRTDADPAGRPRLTDSAYSLDPDASPDWRPGRPLPVRPRRTGARVTAAEVRTLQEMSQVFVDLMERYGGAHARSALAAYLTDDTSRLLVAPAQAALRKQLFSGAAQLTHVLARMTMDAGHPSLAQRYFTTALGLAHEADDRRLYAITLRAMSLQALRLGFHARARQLADTAVDTARSSDDPSARAFLLSQRALTHAYARHRRQAVDDLTAAEAQHDRATGPPGPFSMYPRPGLDYQRGLALLALGDAPQAARALTSSAAARGADRHRSGALTHARLAATLLPLGRLEESCVHWHVFLDHYPGLRAAPADHALKHLRTSLRGFRDRPDAAAVLHHARTVTRPKPAPSTDGNTGPAG